jgi:hypothetical protein
MTTHFHSLSKHPSKPWHALVAKKIRMSKEDDIQNTF